MTRAIAIAAVGWLLPGGGHFLLGQRWRGALLFVWLSATFAAGVAVTRGAAISYESHPLFYYAQMFAGLPFLVGSQVEPPQVFGAPPLPDWIVASIDLGLLYTSVAGLLNLLLLVDAFDRVVSPRPAPPGAPAAA